MAPSRVKKGESSLESNGSPRLQTVSLKSPTRTPSKTPRKHPMKITEGQKQALIDNLQLEITERARKLRAQYVLQAQGLRTRIELRINRIPTSLRKANMGELFEKYMELSKEKQESETRKMEKIEPIKEVLTASKSATIAATASAHVVPKPRTLKRTSDEMETADKENTPEYTQNVPNPKKRTKATRAAENRQATNPSTVLSPKSANSRTIPQSPIRPDLGSPQKAYPSHPMSPLKPVPLLKSASPAKSAAAAATVQLASMLNEKPKGARSKGSTTRKASNPTSMAKPIGSRVKRGLQKVEETDNMRKISNTSDASNASASTTILTKAKKAPSVAAKKKNVGVRANGGKPTVAVDAPSTGRRVLRKRA